MYISTPNDSVNSQRVTPHGILPYIRSACRINDSVTECNHFPLLTITIVAIHILKCIHPILPACHSPYDKPSSTVSSRHSQQWFCGKDRVFKVSIQSNKNTLDRFKVACVEYCACHLHCIHLSTSGKRECIVAQWITLVIVCYSIREIHCVCGVFL